MQVAVIGRAQATPGECGAAHAAGCRARVQEGKKRQ